jgi:hypothetical protein
VPTSAQDKGWADVEPIYILFFLWDWAGPYPDSVVWAGAIQPIEQCRKLSTVHVNSGVNYNSLSTSRTLEKEEEEEEEK